MKKTDPVYIAIANWFNGKRDYEEGTALYEKYGTNKNLKNVFPGHKNRYQRKLEYELSKLIGVSFTKIDRLKKIAIQPDQAQGRKNIPGKTGKRPDPLLPGTLPSIDLDPDKAKIDPANDLPPVIRRIMYEFHDLYKKRTMNFEALKKIQGNSVGETQQRKELLSQIDKFSLRMDVLSVARKSWEDTQVIPDESTLWPGKFTPEIALSRAQLSEKKKNLQKSLSKDQSLLEFQSKKQGEAPVPMPAGPKRDKIEARIKKKEAEIAEINKAINDIDKAQ